MRDSTTGGTLRPLVVPGGGKSARLRPRDGVRPEVIVSARLATPFGALALHATDCWLVGIDFVADPDESSVPSHPVLQAAASQLACYFDDPHTRFSLPLYLAGTDYSRRVWAALAEIPPGQPETYGSLARQLASGPRAVAGACRANAFPILIPCHRVVAARGLGGYGGRLDGPLLDIKRWLLRHEGCPLG